MTVKKKSKLISPQGTNVSQRLEESTYDSGTTRPLRNAACGPRCPLLCRQHAWLRGELVSPLPPSKGSSFPGRLAQPVNDVRAAQPTCVGSAADQNRALVANRGFLFLLCVLNGLLKPLWCVFSSWHKRGWAVVCTHGGYHNTNNNTQ